MGSILWPPYFGKLPHPYQQLSGVRCSILGPSVSQSLSATRSKPRRVHPPALQVLRLMRPVIKSFLPTVPEILACVIAGSTIYALAAILLSQFASMERRIEGREESFPLATYTHDPASYFLSQKALLNTLLVPATAFKLQASYLDPKVCRIMAFLILCVSGLGRLCLGLV